MICRNQGDHKNVGLIMGWYCQKIHYNNVSRDRLLLTETKDLSFNKLLQWERKNPLIKDYKESITQHR